MKLRACLAVLSVLLLPGLAWGGPGGPPAAGEAAAAPAERPPERFAHNFELVLELEMPGATARQTLLLAAPRFRADLGQARFEGQLTPVGEGRALLEYEASVQRMSGEPVRSVERLWWQASVLLAHGVRTAFVATHDTTIRATLRPAP